MPTSTLSVQDNHPGLECSPMELEAESLEAFKLRLQSLQSSRHVYILHELFFFICSCLSSLMHCFRIARSATAVQNHTSVMYRTLTPF